jgi:tetratricopeptide (TPR) repeat protein
MNGAIDDQVSELIDMSQSLFNAGKIDAAEGVLRNLNTLSPGNFQVLKWLAIAQATRGDFISALQSMAQAVAIDANDPLSQNVLSVCQFNGHQYQNALDSADRAIALSRDFAEAHNNRGNALNRLGRHQEALSAFETALALKPRDAELHINIANVLRDLGQADAALTKIDRAIALNPAITEAHCNRGNVLQDLGRHADAIESYDHALAINPNHVDTRWNRSLCNLLLGNFAAGWQDYEWRWLRASVETTPRPFPMPHWLGQEALAGKSILLHCEQGLGDSIQFIRYAPAIARLGATVLLEAFEPLVDLFGSVGGIAEVVPRGGPIPMADFHCPLMSLPLALGAGPAAPPYLSASPERRRKWHAEIGEGAALKVGVVFSGSKTHRGDERRSLPAAEMFEALPVGPAYHILQTELRDTDADILGRRPDLRYFGDRIVDFSDTAALCDAMDVVIAVDTSVAHLAGALGRPTWILLPFDPDWRWMLGKETTDWYASARLYRQAERGDWSHPLGRIAADLSALSQSRR